MGRFGKKPGLLKGKNELLMSTLTVVNNVWLGLVMIVSVVQNSGGKLAKSDNDSFIISNVKGGSLSKKYLVTWFVKRQK